MAEYIKRDTVLQYLDCVAAADEMAMNITKAVVKRIPAEDVVEVRHGRWKKRPNTTGQVYCSECAMLEEITDNSFKSKYCPNCGADMRERRDNDE